MDTETLCLCALSVEPATGYELKQRFEQVYAHFYVAGFGSIYPALGKLADSGLVEFDVSRGPGPRPRKRYRITAEGERALRERLATAEPVHRVHSDFLLLMLMAEHMEPARVDALIDKRVHQINSQLEALEKARATDADAPAGVEFVRDLGQTMLHTAAEFLQTHRNTLISALEAEPDHIDPRSESINGESA
ncbi:MAG TPA: PadR family transcriptional regulator [Gammaproteobacteria bacterium]|nr:PadR family transcriptional regulator [Gammaproteobacteria bacterium]